MPDVTTPSSVEILTSLWQRVLQVPSVGMDDNFFELGGDSALAVQLFAEIAHVCGRKLPPVMIYHVPTIAEQAAILEASAPPQLTPVVRLKPGDENAPVFIAPGLGGGPAEFFQLVRFIDSPHSIYGLQPKGFDGAEEPSASIEDMALFYVDAVRKTQPHGPYLFFGYSLGGLVALEMARILSSRGEATSLLVMIDSYPHITTLPLGQQLQLLEIRARTRILTALRGQGIHRGGTTMDRAQAAAFAPALEHVTDCAYAALQRYRPAFYPGNVKFVRARQLSNFPKDPFATWSDVIPNLEVETVPGDHLGMLTTRFRTLGAVLTKYLLRPDSPGN